jgi:hypothetical protein
MALEEKDQRKLTSDWKNLQDRAEIESGKEGRRSVLRSVKEQVYRGAVLQWTRGPPCDQGLFEPIQCKDFFSKGRPDTFAI